MRRTYPTRITEIVRNEIYNFKRLYFMKKKIWLSDSLALEKMLKRVKNI